MKKVLLFFKYLIKGLWKSTFGRLFLVLVVVVSVFAVINLFSGDEVQNVSPSYKKPEINYTNINRDGIINTYTDGVELGQVNIWESNKNKNNIVGICKKDEKVTVLLSDWIFR